MIRTNNQRKHLDLLGQIQQAAHHVRGRSLHLVVGEVLEHRQAEVVAHPGVAGVHWMVVEARNPIRQLRQNRTSDTGDRG